MLGAIAAACALLLAAPPVHAEARDQPLPGEYRIVSGKVDRGTYAGWLLFHTACYGCHGVDAVGTDLAPNLLQRVGSLTPRDFVAKVLTSYRIVAPPADAGSQDQSAAREAMVDEAMRRQRDGRSRIVMPPWEDDPSVQPHVLDLFAYLSARADGKLGPGKPRRLAGRSR